MDTGTILLKKDINGLFAEEIVRHKSYSMQTRHYHSDIELYFLLEGDRYYFVDQNTWHIHAHSGILIGPNQIHKTSMFNENPEHHRFLLQFSSRPYDALFQSLGYPPFDSLARLYQEPVSFDTSDWSSVLSLLTQLQSGFAANAGRSTLLLLGMQLLDLFCSSARKQQMPYADTNFGQPPGSSSAPELHQKIDELAQYLQQHCSEKIVLDDLAAEFYFSRSRMTAAFKQITGFTIVEYITFMRIRRARELLLHTDHSITEIAEETGFGNVTYFERVFRITVGKSPLQFRKKGE